MNVLLDANILIRTADPSDAQHAIAKTAVSMLRSKGDIPLMVPQTLFEFWVVATRPKDKNGLGLTPAESLQEITNFKGYFSLLTDSQTLYEEWESLVSKYNCSGKVAHDARYVAAMKTHVLTHFMTFNVGDFARFPGITVIDPRIVAV